MHQTIQLVCLLIGALYTLGAAITDWQTRKITNAYNLAWMWAIMPLKLAYYPLLMEATMGALVMSFCLLLMYVLHAAGGGDVKMMALLGFLLGWPWICYVFILATGVELVILGIWKLTGRTDLRPFGVSVACGCWGTAAAGVLGWLPL
jgi:Flp pilus assembly protein protease CpaA